MSWADGRLLPLAKRRISAPGCIGAAPLADELREGWGGRREGMVEQPFSPVERPRDLVGTDPGQAQVAVER